MLSNFSQFVNDNKKELILFITIVLISLLSFAVGFITAKLQEREPLQIIGPTGQEAPGKELKIQ